MSFVLTPSIITCHSFDFWHKILFDFLFCNATDCSPLGIETLVCQVIEYREKGNLCEFGDTCYKHIFLKFISLL